MEKFYIKIILENEGFKIFHFIIVKNHPWVKNYGLLNHIDILIH